MTDADHSIGLFLRLLFNGTRFGPGKAQLLRGIRDTGSISSAGRAMGMSYKRAWSLVEEMNAAFAAPVVETARGGAGGGGARLTETGAEVLMRYEAVLEATRSAGAGDIAALTGLLRTRSDMSGGK